MLVLLIVTAIPQVYDSGLILALPAVTPASAASDRPEIVIILI
jgi:hypothetical protein